MNAIDAADPGRSARLSLVEQHIARENAHDLPGLLETFGKAPHYEDEAWGERHQGLDGVRRYYEDILAALPDLRIEVFRTHSTSDAVLVEVIISGTHRGPWRGLPATGRPVVFPLCGIYTFDTDNRLAGEKIYYDRASVLRQLGVFHEPESLAGKLSTVVTHPLTLSRALVGSLFR